MTTLHYVKKARKDNKAAGIKKGDSYYWWQFAFGRKQCSKEHPRRSQYMTQSQHLGAIYDVEDQIEAMTTKDIVDGCLDDVISQIEEIKENCESNLDNIPEQLKYASAGETLQQYIDGCESWISDLEGVDFSSLDNDFQADAENEVDESDFTDDEGNIDEAALQDAITEKADELEEEAKQSILDEIQGIQYPG